MTRTDIHSPSNFDPADYEYVGWFYMGPDEIGMFDPETTAALEALDVRGWQDGNFARKSQCDHCGARFLWVTVWEHTPTGVCIAVGETCAAERFSCPDRMTYEIKRARQALAAKRQRERMKAQAREFISGLSDVAYAVLTEEYDSEHLNEVFAARTHYIVQDIRSKLYQYGSLSVQQVALVERIHDQETERLKRQRNQEDEVKVAAPEGRHTIEGRVLKTEWRDTEFGDRKVMTLKIETPKGVWLAWGTVPSAIIRTERGDLVQFTATFKRGDDEHFAFFKRPSKAMVLEEAGEEVEATALD